MDSGADLEMVPIDDDHWLIRDRRYSPSDARHVLACVTESDQGFDVLWLDAAIPLPVRYRTREDVLHDLTRWRSRRPAATRPVQIPSLPPFGRSRQRRAG